MKFQVEKDGISARQKGLKDGWTGGYEEFEPDLEPLAGILKAVNKLGGRVGIGDVQCDDQSLASLLQRV